jgi:hypothetical protein
MKYLYYLLGHFPHLLVFLTYIYCLISVYKTKNKSSLKASYIVYFSVAALVTLLSTILNLTISYTCAFLFISFDFIFFLNRADLLKRISIYILPFLFLMNLILVKYFSEYFALNNMLSFYSVFINIFILIFLLLHNKLKICNQDYEDVFWFNASYKFYAISTISCDLVLLFGEFGERSWTCLFIYNIIYGIWITKSFFLLKSYKCTLSKDL